MNAKRGMNRGSPAPAIKLKPTLSLCSPTARPAPRRTCAQLPVGPVHSAHIWLPGMGLQPARLHPAGLSPAPLPGSKTHGQAVSPRHWGGSCVLGTSVTAGEVAWYVQMCAHLLVDHSLGVS